MWNIIRPNQYQARGDQGFCCWFAFSQRLKANSQKLLI